MVRNVADQQGFLEAPDATLNNKREEAAGQRMGKETRKGGQGVNSADGYCGGDDGMVAPSDVIVHGPGSVEDMLKLEDIKKQLDSAAAESRKKVCPLCRDQTAAHGVRDAEMVAVAPQDSAAETEASEELGVWINQDEGVDADSFVRWVPDDNMSRQFKRDTIKSLLSKIATDDKCMTVIGFQEFPYTAGNTLKWNDREVEREYWVRVDGVDKRLGGVDNLVIFHVHYAGKWHPVQTKRDRSVIQQVNMRHTTKRMEKTFHKKCEDLDKWREAFGTAVPDIPKEGWEWKLRPDVSPGLHKVLTEAERCTTYVRSIALGGGQPDAEGQSRGKVDWAGLRVAGLCIGVGEYKHLGALNNAVRDAEQVNARLNNVPSCRSDIVKDPKTKIELKSKIRKRLEEPRLQEKPPELFCIYYAGHAFEHGAKVYLVPTDARLEHVVDDCDDECLSLDSLMQLLREKLDNPTRLKMGQDRAIVFVIVLDSCRNAAAGRSIGRDQACQVAPDSAPHKYTVFFSCSRTTTASDGPSGGHSPFARALLDAEGGFFAQGVTLRDAISNVSRAVEQGTQQIPIEVRITAIPPDFCIWTKPLAQPGPGSAAGSVDVSEGAGAADMATFQYEIVEYLKKRGLGRIAERVGEDLGLEEIDDLKRVELEEIGQLEWLKPQQKKKLLELVREVTARLMSADDNELSADDTNSQGASTPLAYDTDSEDVLIAARNGGDCADFKQHMTGLMRDFFRCFNFEDVDPEWETFDWGSSWTLSMLLWIRFAHDATLEQSLRDKWLQTTTNSPNQDQLLSILTECLESPGTIHPRWSPAESCECRKEHAAGISFTDAMVEHALRGNENAKQKWRENVVQDWFLTDEPFSAFLSRANKFLRDPEHSIKGMSIFKSLVETQSYVVFTKLSGLAASLLFGYLEARKLDLASAGGAARGGRTLLHGFTIFVSSEGHAFSLSRTGMHSLHVIVQGLQGMVHLAHTCWEMMGPVKTAQAFLLLQEDHIVELDTQEALFLSKQKDVPWEDGSHDEGRVAEESRMKEVRKIYNVSHGVIRNYLEALRERWGHYIDSASGERLRVDCQAVSLLLVKGKSLHDVCDSGGSTRQEDLICPISQSIMQHPVKCSDGHTDERKYIEEHFELALEKRSTPEEDKLVRRSRLGHDARDGDSTGSKEGGNTNADVPFYTAEKFLEKFLQEIRLACLTGPPASGKTVTMQQVVCTHAATSFDNIHRQPQKDLALLPVFMRAAELPKLLSDNDKRVKNMKDLVELFVSANIQEGTFDVGVKNLILELLDHGKVLICIDGLDEASQHQDLVERIIDGAVIENRNLHILLSTREHSYRHSRGCLRLGAFDVVNLQPLDKDRQQAMIEDRLSKDKVGKFQEHLEAVASKNPELATSPFLLSLIIEVYKEEGVIPTKRVELYDKQVKAIVSRCIYQRRLACIERDDKKGSLQILEKNLAADADALEVSIDYLGTLAFVCQMRLTKRDFTLAASLRYEQELWQDMLHIEQQHFNGLARINPRLRGRQQELLTLLHHTPDLLTRSRELMLGNPIVGLLTVVGDKVYRFSHLTLQEYLAARCIVRFFGHDAQELLKKLTTFTDSASPRPLNSLWNRIVLQFAACMLSEQVFEGFCQLVLASDDGTGSHCELVQDFLKERGASEKVEQMVCDRLQEIRDNKRLKTAYKPLTIPDSSKAKTAESAMAIKELQSVVDDKNTRAADVGSRAKVELRQERSGAATAPAARRGEHDTAVMAAPTAIYKHTKALADDVGIHRLRLAIVETPENLDSVTIEEFTRACTESVQGENMGACNSTSSVHVASTAAAAITSDAADTAARPAEAARAAQQGGCTAAADARGEGGNGSGDELKGMRAEIENLRAKLEVRVEQHTSSLKFLAAVQKEKAEAQLQVERLQAKAEEMQAHRNAAEAAKGQQGSSEKHSSEREVLSESVKTTALAAEDARQRMGSALNKFKKVGTPFTSGAPSTPRTKSFENTVQTRRELELLVEIEQARQRIMQQVLPWCWLVTNVEY